MFKDEYSSYDSEEEDDQVDPTYLNRVLSQQNPKTADYLQLNKNFQDNLYN